MKLSKKTVWGSAVLYLILWFTTWIVGIPAVDHYFDEKLREGSSGLATANHTPKTVQIVRVPFREIRDPRNFPKDLPQTPWRCRSNGIAIAPFLIIDEAAWLQHSLSGYSGVRLILWLPGFTQWFSLKTFWVS